ncbi:hypothetical protein BRIN106911_04770 [Brevibacillus invocatus]
MILLNKQPPLDQSVGGGCIYFVDFISGFFHGQTHLGLEPVPSR